MIPHVVTTDQKTGQTQLWEVLPTEAYYHHTSHILSAYGSIPDLYKIKTSIKFINLMTYQHVRMIPLVVTDPLVEIKSRDQYRGYAGYRDVGADSKPFITRGKPLGEITAHFRKTVSEYGELDYFSHSPALTKCQQKELHKRFAMHLTYACNPELLY